MRIAVVGRGNVGGGLADLWERTGHGVTRLGRDGGDVSDAEVVLVAVPGGSIADALDRVKGVAGKTVIDATNLYRVVPPDGFASNAEFVKSKTNGPTAKSFNINFASLYGRLGEARVRPSNLWCGDEAARQVVEQAQSRRRLRPGLHGADRERRSSGSAPRGDLRDQSGDGSVRVPVCATREFVNRGAE
jgi:8-hydroxy-5-deazaflavin:NADPH oxidoreductase